MRGPVLLCLWLLVAAGCQARAVRTEAPRGDFGSLYLYLRPLPEEAARLRLTLTAAAAVGVEGQTVPLELRFVEVDGREGGRQRLLAAGLLPPGSYRGFSLTVGKAWLRGEDGEASLLVPDEPVLVEAPFTVGPAEAALLEAAYRHEGAVTQGFRFSPAFHAYVPPRPVFSRVGYAASFAEDHLAVFDRKTLEVVSVIATGRGPRSVVLDESSRRAYAALAEEDAVEVVDVAAGRVTARVQLRSGDRPWWLAVTPAGLLVCANRDSDTVSFIDGRSAVEVDRLPVGDEPVSVLVDRPGRRAYVLNARSDTISVLDLASRSVVGAFPVEAGPLQGALNRAGDRLYVIHRNSPYLLVVDTRRLAPVERVLVGPGASSVHVDPRTDFLYVANRHSTRVDLYDPFSLLPVDFLEAGGAPADLVIDDEENRLFLALPEQGAVSAVDLIGKRLRGLLDVGREPRSLAVWGARD